MKHDLPIREPDDLRLGCADKLQKVKTSGKFSAILACLLNEDWTTPRLVEMHILRDGGLLGRRADDIGFNDWLGAEEDLIRNIHGVATAAKLDGDELGYLLGTVARLKRIE